jgi:cysteine desulfurase
VRHFYFDHNATTPVSAEAMEALFPCLGEVYGNPSSIHHFGQAAKQRLEAARREVAGLLGASPKEIVFTSGGTESDNLAILGVVRNARAERRHVITTEIEHPAVLGACAQLEREGVEVTRVRAGASGVVDAEEVRRAILPYTTLVSVMHANNETGVVQPVEEIARVAHDAGAWMHVDGVQAAGKIPVDAATTGADLYSISGHKFYAPKGVGALYVRAGTPLGSIAFGGRQERERRPGTENIPGIAAMGRAAGWMRSSLAGEGPRLAALRDRLEAAILSRVPAAGVNGARAPRTPNTSNIYFDDIDGEALVIALDLGGFAVSTGAACSSGAVEPSHVLLAMGLAKERAKASIRFSLGRANDEAQVDALAEAVAQSVERLRTLSPVNTRRESVHV